MKPIEPLLAVSLIPCVLTSLHLLEMFLSLACFSVPLKSANPTHSGLIFSTIGRAGQYPVLTGWCPCQTSYWKFHYYSSTHHSRYTSVSPEPFSRSFDQLSVISSLFELMGFCHLLHKAHRLSYDISYIVVCILLKNCLVLLYFSSKIIWYALYTIQIPYIHLSIDRCTRRDSASITVSWGLKVEKDPIYWYFVSECSSLSNSILQGVLPPPTPVSELSPSSWVCRGITIPVFLRILG